jgi:hypothetical protein
MEIPKNTSQFCRVEKPRHLLLAQHSLSQYNAAELLNK